MNEFPSVAVAPPFPVVIVPVAPPKAGQLLSCNPKQAAVLKLLHTLAATEVADTPFTDIPPPPPDTVTPLTPTPSAEVQDVNCDWHPA
jgi:hypothetical protein